MRCNNFKYREVVRDEKYHSALVTKLINKVMRNGKKELAKKQVYGSLDIIKQKLDKNPLEVLEKAVENLSPAVENKSRKRGGITIQVPFEVKEPRRISISLRWIVSFAKELIDKHNKDMTTRLATEIMNVYNNTGKSIEAVRNVKTRAEANKAFVILKW